MGRPLTREEALRSPRNETVWAIVDALSVSVDPIAEQVAGGRPTPQQGQMGQAAAVS